MTPSYVMHFSMTLYIPTTIAISLANCYLLDRFPANRHITLCIIFLNGIITILLGGQTIFVSLHLVPKVS